MAPLDSTTRTTLPDSAFAYVDSRGRRRLPIHDEAHVRNALARFSQVRFEDDSARERARTRLLKAAKKHRIVPVGFINGQLQSERGRERDPVELPTGFVTMLMTDIEGSTSLVDQLGDGYRDLLNEVRSTLAAATAGAGGYVAETRADEFFAAFEQPSSAIEAAVAIHRALRARSWPKDVDVRVRIGIHSGYPTRSAPNYIGMAVHTTARICDATHGGQTVVSGATKEAVQGATPVRLRRLGEFRLRGLPDPVELFQVVAKGLPTRFPPPHISRR
jgi:class 3 adenylate cyclase